jgi:hypothetical protein
MRAVKLLLLIPMAGLLVPVIYNRRLPELFAIPFFYWYQLLWVPITIALILIVNQRTRNERPWDT